MNIKLSESEQIPFMNKMFWESQMVNIILIPGILL
ncbi:unknown [Clostridium sp. CAG:167]|nr:unknown [Clostridium sp. CAG:167]